MCRQRLPYEHHPRVARQCHHPPPQQPPRQQSCHGGSLRPFNSSLRSAVQWRGSAAEWSRRRPATPFGARDLLAMTSHNIGDAQRPPGVPLSAGAEASGTGGFAALRSAAIHHRALCEVMPSLRVGLRSAWSQAFALCSGAPLPAPTPGQVPRQAANASRFADWFTTHPVLAPWRLVLVASSCGRSATVPRPPERVPHREPGPDGATRVPRSPSPPVPVSPCGWVWIAACVEMLRPASGTSQQSQVAAKPPGGHEPRQPLHFVPTVVTSHARPPGRPTAVEVLQIFSRSPEKGGGFEKRFGVEEMADDLFSQPWT